MPENYWHLFRSKDDLTHLTADTTNWVVLDQPEKAADKVLLDYKAPVAAAIMLLMIAMMVSGMAVPPSASPHPL